MEEKTLSIIGCGRLGICMALTAVHSGYDVIAMDIDATRVEKINSRTLNSPEPDVEKMLSNLDNAKLLATTNLKETLDHSNLVYIIVPTPDGPNGYDHGILESVLTLIHATNYKGTIVICCTVIPGFMSKDIASKISYNPLFVRQGKIISDLVDPSTILIGEYDKYSE